MAVASVKYLLPSDTPIAYKLNRDSYRRSERLVSSTSITSGKARIIIGGGETAKLLTTSGSCESRVPSCRCGCTQSVLFAQVPWWMAIARAKHLLPSDTPVVYKWNVIRMVGASGCKHHVRQGEDFLPVRPFLWVMKLDKTPRRPLRKKCFTITVRCEASTTFREYNIQRFISGSYYTCLYTQSFLTNHSIRSRPLRYSYHTTGRSQSNNTGDGDLQGSSELNRNRFFRQEHAQMDSFGIPAAHGGLLRDAEAAVGGFSAHLDVRFQARVVHDAGGGCGSGRRKQRPLSLPAVQKL